MDKSLSFPISGASAAVDAVDAVDACESTDGRGEVEEAPAAAVRADPRRRRVLVVDDNVDSAASMAMILEGEDHEVHIAHDGLAALEAVERHAPHVVLLDLGLPGLDGYAVAERIRRRDPAREITLIAATGRGQDKDREKSNFAGFDLHLVKPLDPDVVIRVVAESRLDGGAPPAPPALPAAPAALQPAPVEPVDRIKVLVVDDSPLMCESAAAILEFEGYEVRTASDGMEALAVVEEWSPRIVLLDVHMPRLNGIETARRLRIDHPHGALGLLMMSGVSLDQAWISHARAAGFDDCLDKTADPEVWLESLQRLAVSLESA